jgi:hypothetical protein
VTGEVLSVQKATEASVYHRIADMADPLHFGTFGGVWTQALWLLFGLLLSTLMLSGGWLWHLRAEQKARAAGASRHPRWGYVAAAVPAVVIIGSGVFGYLEVERNYMMREAPRRVTVQACEVGPWRARLLEMPSPGTDAASYRVRFSGPNGAAANLASAMLKWTGTPDSTAAQRHPSVPVTRLLTTPAPATTDSTLTIAATTRSGTTYRDTVAVSADIFPVEEGALAQASLPIPPVPAAVWVVISLFVVLTLGIIAAWLVVAQRTARRRAEQETGSSAPDPQPAAVTADLPSPER